MTNERKSLSMAKRNRDALIIDAIGGGLCPKHGKYFGHGKHGLRACPFCDIEEYYSKLGIPVMKLVKKR